MIFQNNCDYFKKHLVHFKGGGSSTTINVDKEYNARLATIAEQQQKMSQEYYEFYKHGSKGHYETQGAVVPMDGKMGEWGFSRGSTERVWVPDEDGIGFQDMEQAQIEANYNMIPYETGLAKDKILAEQELLPGQVNLGKSNTSLGLASNEAAMSLLPSQTNLAQARIGDDLTAINERAPVRNAFYSQSLTGVNAEDRATRAGTDAAHSFANSNDIMRRNAGRMGINPNSGRFDDMINTNSINEAKTISGAKTKARNQAEQENYNRLTSAMGYGG